MVTLIILLKHSQKNTSHMQTKQKPQETYTQTKTNRNMHRYKETQTHANTEV